jgi:hypothetical protein
MLVHGNADCREILPSQSAAAIAGDSFYMRRILERLERGVLTISDATRSFSSQQVVRSACAMHARRISAEQPLIYV